MVEPTVEALKAALARHASANGEVFPSALKRIAAEEHWTGRLWDVACLIASDIDTMRFEAGGDRADEIAECAGRWAESRLSLDDIELVLASGGYDPDPFTVLAREGLLHLALRTEEGTPRLVNGERAGIWISDELALSASAEIVDRTRRIISGTAEAIVDAG